MPDRSTGKSRRRSNASRAPHRRRPAAKRIPVCIYVQPNSNAAAELAVSLAGELKGQGLWFVKRPLEKILVDEDCGGLPRFVACDGGSRVPIAIRVARASHGIAVIAAGEDERRHWLTSWFAASVPLVQLMGEKRNGGLRIVVEYINNDAFVPLEAWIGRNTKMTAIHELDLGGMEVTYSDIATASRLPHLRLLDLRGTGVTRAELESVRPRLSQNVQVLFGRSEIPTPREGFGPLLRFTRRALGQSVSTLAASLEVNPVALQETEMNTSQVDCRTLASRLAEEFDIPRSTRQMLFRSAERHSGPTP